MCRERVARPTREAEARWLLPAAANRFPLAALVNALRVLADHGRVVAGDAATIRTSHAEGVNLHVLEISPTRNGTPPISMAAGQSLVVSGGHPGGRCEFAYTDHDLAFARDVVTAVINGRINGRVNERTAARSAVIPHLRNEESGAGKKDSFGIAAPPADRPPANRTDRGRDPESLRQWGPHDHPTARPPP